MTILCLALGNPVPNVKLYVGGHFVREEMTRHMVTTVHNVTTDMEHISCYADNGKCLDDNDDNHHHLIDDVSSKNRLRCADADSEKNQH